MIGAPPKFNFVPEKQLLQSIDPTYKVTIYAKKMIDKDTGEVSFTNNLIFTKPVVDVFELKDKFIRFYADKEKKTVGWSILEKAEGLIELEGVRQIKVNAKGIVLFGIGKLLKSVNLTLKENRKNLIVKTYKSSLQSHDIYYITL